MIHDAILEAVTCGNTQIPAADFLSASHQLREVDRFTGITGVESQFHVSTSVYGTALLTQCTFTELLLPTVVTGSGHSKTT